MEKGIGELLFRKDKLLRGLVGVYILYYSTVYPVLQDGEKVHGLWEGEKDLVFVSSYSKQSPKLPILP